MYIRDELSNEEQKIYVIGIQRRGKDEEGSYIRAFFQSRCEASQYIGKYKEDSPVRYIIRR